jgi:uncharacterized protein (TIGR02117 family)
MKIIKTAKITGLLLISIIGVVGLYLLSALVLSRIGVPAEQEKGNDIAVYVLSNGVHTDIVMPVKSQLKDWSKEIKFKDTELKDSSMCYVAVGWGDKEFYLNTPTWADLKFTTAFKAAFGLGNAAIHATFYKNMTESENCIKIELTTAQYGKLVNYVDAGFKKDSAGHYIHINTHANYGTTDAFYEATKKYSIFFTSNTWTNKALKVCGQKACVWTPFDKGIFFQYKK